MGESMRCPYCGLLQDEPQGAKICVKCGASLEDLVDSKPCVFIAYSRNDGKFVDKLVLDLKARGVTTWRDVDDIKGAAFRDQAQWRKIIDKALKTSAAMVVVLSPSSIDSNEVMAEWSYFSEQKKPLVPVIATECDVPFFLKIYQIWDLSKNYNGQIDDLASVLAKITDATPIVPIHKPRPTPPIWKILSYAILPIFILGMALFVWPGVLRGKNMPVETTSEAGALTMSPTEEETKAALALPSDLGTPAAESASGSPVDLIKSSPSPTNTATAVSNIPLGFITATPGILGDKIDDDEAWINSYPIGAKIFLVEATTSLSAIEIPDVATSANFVGIAPVIFEIPPGNYYLVAEFGSSLFDSGGFLLPSGTDPTFDGAFPFDGNSINQFMYNDDDSVATIRKLYRLEKRAGDPEPLICIAVPVPENERQLSGITVYPSLAAVKDLPVSFDYVEDSMRASITQATKDTELMGLVGEDVIDEMLAVLLRVGKVRLSSGNAAVIVQMSNFGKSGWATSVYE